MKKIAISIHAIEDFTVDILKGLEGYDYIHIDFMDGFFVNNECNNLDVFKKIKESFDTPIIAHLMVVNPFEYIKKIINFIDIFLFHFESNNKLTDIIKEVKTYNKQVGVAINPKTNVNDIIPYLNKIDLVLIMSVLPGWSGQKFINASIEKVNILSQYKKKYDFIIDIDGGIDLTNAKQLKNTDILTSASTILKAEDPNKIIKLLKYSDENE